MPISKSLEKDSLRWFFDELRSNYGNNAKKAIKKVVFPEAGKLYHFRYDAKLKDVLPYWDAFPLVFPFSLTATHFTGLNMHYLPPTLRKEFFDELKKFLNVGQKKITIDYSKLKSSRFLAACIHRYLPNHIRSNFYEVAYDKWEKVLYLPTQKFQKQSASQVWSNV